MKKNNGFTLVEIIVSFALTMIIMLFLFQLIITLKQIYNNNFLTSDLVLKQSNISQMINKDLLVSNLGKPQSVNEDIVNQCFNINFEFGRRNVCYNKDNNTIIYNDYEFELVKGSKIGNVSVNIQNDILFIEIPISYPDVDNNINIKVAYFK